MGTLAITGGSKAGSGIKSQWPFVNKSDINNITRIVKRGKGGWCRLYDKWGGTESEVGRFEKAWAKYHDAKYALAIANGTVAIETALMGLHLEQGSEVIVPAITFIASASGVLMARGIPIFADIDPETCQISAKDIERKITKRTAGIAIVHYGGYPVNLTAIKKVAKKHGLFVLEDSAHAQGTEWKGRKIGAIGDVGTFSFQGSKSLTCGEGGAIVSDKKEIMEDCFAYHHIGRTLGSAKYEHTIVGPNYRLSELQAAVLNTQLKKLQKQTETRMRTAGIISKATEDIPGLQPLKKDKRITQRGYYFYILRFDEKVWGIKRATFIEACNVEGISIGSGYGCPLYELPLFKNNDFDQTGYPVSKGKKAFGRITNYSRPECPNADRVSRYEHLTVSNHILNFSQNGRVYARVFRKLWDNVDELRTLEKK